MRACPTGPSFLPASVFLSVKRGNNSSGRAGAGSKAEEKCQICAEAGRVWPQSDCKRPQRDLINARLGDLVEKSQLQRKHQSQRETEPGFTWWLGLEGSFSPLLFWEGWEKTSCRYNLTQQPRDPGCNCGNQNSSLAHLALNPLTCCETLESRFTSLRAQCPHLQIGTISPCPILTQVKLN